MPLAPNALMTLEELEEEGIVGQTATLERQVNTISGRIERYCNRVFRRLASVDEPDPEADDPPQVGLERLYGTGSQLLCLARPPIESIQRIRIAGAEVTGWQIWDAAEGLVYLASGWPNSVGHWPDLTQDPRPDARVWTIDAAYIGGYAEIPAELKTALVLELQQMRSLPANSRMIAERTPGGWQQNFGDIGKAHNWRPETRAILAEFQRTFYA